MKIKECLYGNGDLLVGCFDFEQVLFFQCQTSVSYPIIEDSPAIILLLKSSVVRKTAIFGTRELLVTVLMKQHHTYTIFYGKLMKSLRDIALFLSDDCTGQNKNVSELPERF